MPYWELEAHDNGQYNKNLSLTKILLKFIHPLTHWGWDKMAAIFADDIFKYLSFNENLRILIHISLKLVPNGPINNNPSLVQIIQTRPTSQMHLRITRTQCVNNSLTEKDLSIKCRIMYGLVWITIFCHEWGDSAMIFRSDEVKSENHHYCIASHYSCTCKLAQRRSSLVNNNHEYRFPPTWYSQLSM